MTGKKATASPPAPGVPYYTPAQDPPSGTALELADHPEAVPTLFKPLTIRGVTLNNRFVVSPMCMYSADDGHLTDFHLVHLGSFALRGAGLTIVEATSVTSNGRISPEDSGLWQDSQIAPLRRITDFIHSQGHKAGVQLGHAGRKASTLAPWHAARGTHDVAGEDVGGWPDNVWGPSAVPFSEFYPQPKEMTIEQIEGLVKSFEDAAKRAVTAGFDVIEIHAAHGYLITEFMSPLSNHRADKYGGSFENRVRLLLDVVKAVRGAIPETMPLFVRISATEWMEWSGRESWDFEQSVRLAHLLPPLGVDLLDVSSGGNSSEQKIQIHPYYQVDLAGKIRASLHAAGAAVGAGGGRGPMLVGAVGMITNAEMARDIVQEDKLCERGSDPEKGECAHGRVEEVGEGEDREPAKADVVIIARQFLREPEFVLRVAQHLGVPVKWAHQHGRAGWPRNQVV
ncbi:NADPH dehydrogenase [Pleurostoma richardsiae]|uniref:NADPH dehydrogenase n=1 Tax=Pleurostoma richardsiae TaxID=41990 RepID=A0AA38RUG4_9PEZI|nr:NADPH dehydrogenase [Pleurostoma richardsiae]